ncbi:MAG: acetyltransferase [Fusobacteriaceae bacterium]
MKKLIILGAGGFAKSIIDAIDESQYKLVGFIDSFKKGEHQGYKILANSIEEIEDKEKYIYFIGIGDPKSREEYFYNFKKYDLKLANIIDKTSILSRNITMGEGIFIGKRVIVNADTVLEDNVVLNTRSLIEHGNYIGAHTNISTNSVLNGDVKVGSRTFIGSCTVVNGQIKIGNDSIIGSGSIVIRDVEDNVVEAGTPIRFIRRNENE